MSIRESVDVERWLGLIYGHKNESSILFVLVLAHSIKLKAAVFTASDKARTKSVVCS